MNNVNLIKRTKSIKSDFLIAHNKLVQNSNVSFESRGLLVMLLSLPDDWVLHKSWIMKEYKIGRDKLNRMFKELKDNGYLVEMEMIRENGKFKGKNYMIYDTPQNDVKEISPMYQNPSTVEPHTVEPSTANDTTTKNISIDSTYSKKENTLTKAAEHDFSSIDVCIQYIKQHKTLPAQQVPKHLHDKLNEYFPIIQNNFKYF